MSGIGKSFGPALLWLCAALLLSAAAFPLGRWAARGDAAGATPDLDKWDVPRLNQHLNRQGMGLRLVPTSATQGVSSNAYLTRTQQGWEELANRPKVAERVASWRGTVYCERMVSPASRDLQIDLWGDCCWSVGPFVFFGDRELLTEIRTCLDGTAHLPAPVTAYAVAE
jgi:hypothetical protein